MKHAPGAQEDDNLPHHFREKPLLKWLLASFQTFPGIGDIL